jgi:eukaryotic-like serine/threonine-protein kinase
MVGTVLGSPLYMSPEQAIGDASVGPRADLWALGVLLFEMLTGTRPFYASTAFAVVAKILRGPIPTVMDRAPGVPPALSAVVARCLVRRPAERVASAAELCALLLPFAGAREHPTQPPPLPMLQPEDEEDEETAFFRKRPGATAAEMMAAAEALAAPEPFSSGELHGSGEVLSSGDILAASAPPDGTMPLPLVAPRPPAPDTPPPSGDLGRTVTPLIQPGEAPTSARGDDALDPSWAKRPPRTGLWITLAGVVAVILAGAYYLSEGSAPGPKIAPAVSAAPVPSTAPTPPAITAATPTAAPEAAPSATVAPPSSASATSPATAHPPAPSARATAAPTSKPGGRIIRETPF